MAGNNRRSTRLARSQGNQAVADSQADQSGTQVQKSKRAHETDSENDFDEKPQKKRTKTRTKKKDQSKAVTVAKPRKRRGASLSMLVDQPLDIILTICQFTTNPRDFVSLMQVNRAFYDLLSTHAIATWTGMRVEFKIPDPLPVGPQRYNEYYSREEVEKIEKELEELKSRLPERLAYVVSREEYRDEQNSLYHRALGWLQDYRKSEEDEVCAIRAKAIQKRFVELGYSDEDAQKISKSSHLREPKKLTDREWDFVKEEALELMSEYRVTLVCKNPIGRVFVQRRELVRETYTQFKKALGPGKWLRTPPLEAICRFPEVLKILILPDNVVCTSADFSGALELCRSVIEQWSDGVSVSGGVRRGRINEIAKNAFGPNFTGEYPEILDSTYYSPRYAKDCDKLAVYGFRCNRCPHYNQPTSIFTSLDVAFSHNKCYLTTGASLECLPHKPWVDLQGPHYVHIQLLYLSQLKIATTTVDDMDTRGDFFKCLDCAASPDPEKRARSVATWRECIIKHRHSPLYEPNEVKFEIVHEEVEDVRQCWACAHCNVHVDALVTRREVHDHLLDVHSISDPSVPGDFLYAGPY
ncbi:hypothetical protein VNI00_012275 [Paramarasmius palmivorus]|uniref:F-box domain-containing protein n=1 Tax=Paramarasmius palmivorus TaxID=297713 RepID=A0AAW0C7V5_9AGAR